MAERASRTSSSLNGLMIAVTNFIFRPSKDSASLAKRDRQGSESLLNECCSCRPADVLAGDRVRRFVVVGIGPVRAEGVAVDRVTRPQLPVRVVEDAVAGAVGAAVILLAPDVREDGPLIADRIVSGQVEVPGIF